MAHKILADGRKVIDWETGDPEGDRKWMMKNYSDFINEVKSAIDNHYRGNDTINDISGMFKDWNISTDNQVDDFPRIWIKRPNSNKP